MKYKISIIETAPLLYEGMWMGSSVEIYIEREDHSVFTIRRVYERNKIRLHIDRYKEQKTQIADVMARSIAHEVGRVENISHFAQSFNGPIYDEGVKYIYNVLRLKLPVFLTYMFATTLAIYQNDTNEWVDIKHFPVDEDGKYNVAEVNMEEWPWCIPTPFDAEKLTEELRYQDLLDKIMMQ